MEENQLNLTQYGNTIATYDLTDFIKQIMENYKTTNQKPNTLQFIGTSEKYDIQANINHLEIQENTDTHEFDIQEIYFDNIFLREK